MSLLLALTAGGGGGAVNYTLACDAGSYSYAGVDAAIPVSRNLAAAVGTYAYSGIDAAIPVSRQIAGAAGAYAYSGVAAAAPVSRNLAGAAGAYAYAGVDAPIPVSRKFAADAGAYAYAGQDATLTYVPGAGSIAYTLLCDAGAYLLTGNDAVLTKTGTSEEQYSGGYATLPERRKRTPEELKAERIALGILPADVAKAANVIAKQAITTATEQRAPDVLEWLDQRNDEYEQALRAEMAQYEQEWATAYRNLVAMAVQEALQIEEETILMLMMEL
jgi:hypothetical protein